MAGWSIHGLFLAAKAVALAAEQPRPETALWSRLRGSALIGQGKPLRLFSPSVPFFPQFRTLLTQQPVFRARNSVVSGKSVSVRVDLVGRRIIQKKQTQLNVLIIKKN